ncbi:MAG: stage III sporulation protein AF [Clostridia bacterium]|nr:stage III sporulation protein AF [Clostridia bacterium]
MLSWLLNIVGIVFIGVILDVVLPDGKTNQFIKHVFSVFMLFVVVSPVSNWVSSAFNVEVSSGVTDSNFLYVTNLEKINALEKDIVSEIESGGISNVSVIINGNVFEEVLTINSVYVDVSNAVSENNLTKSEVKDFVLDKILINVDVVKEDIVFYG